MGRYDLGGGGPFWNGIPLIGSQPDISGNSYFVDGANGSDDYTGKSWSKPFKTLERAIYISNIDIAKSGMSSRRNTIFFAGAPITTNLTIFPNKTDVIGCGSYGTEKMACIVGAHSPSGQDTRFHNILFKATSAAVDLRPMDVYLIPQVALQRRQLVTLCPPGMPFQNANS